MSRSPMAPHSAPSERLKFTGFKGEERRSRDRYKDQAGHTIPQSPDPIERKRNLLKRYRPDVWTSLQSKDNENLPSPHESEKRIDIIRPIPEPFTELALGRTESEFEPELPVLAHKQAFLDSVAHYQVTIATAETGAGKSTQFPQYLVEAGYNVSMTQPRRISASSLTQQIQKELTAVLGDEAEGLAGCHTAGENTTIPGKTRVSVVTDGLRLVQEFGEREELDYEVLIIDEVHEWNCNIEILIAQVKRLTKEKPHLRIVILSATMESEKLAEYFSDSATVAPIMEIEGRNFDVAVSEKPDSTVVEQAAGYAAEGHNVLVFLPGVREIEDTMSAIQKELEDKGIMNATILPLHSKLSGQEQQAVMQSYPGPKIICATNIAQTSITIPDVTRVVMSGYERRKEIDDEAVESLNLRPVSRKDLIQQMGRCGRVEDGEAVVTCLNKDMPYVPIDSELRPEYPVPEILRTDLDRNVLLVASKGDDFAELDLFHPVKQSMIERSKRALYLMGALDAEGKITNQGMRMIKLPMRPMYSRMVTFAEDENYNARTRTYVAAMVSAMEVGGMPSWLRDSSRDWRNEIDEADDSDHISHLRLFIKAQQLSDREKYELGLDVHSVEKAQELYRKVCKKTNVQVQTELAPPNNEEIRQIRQAITSGLMDYVYQSAGGGYVRTEGTSGEIRGKSNRTTIRGFPTVIVGNPAGVERIRGGIVTKESIVQNITGITAANLGIVATWLCEWTDGELRWKNGRLKQVQRQLFKSIPTGMMREEDATASPAAIRAVEQYVMAHSGSAFTELKEIKKELESLQKLTPETLPEITQDQLEGMIRSVMSGGTILDPGYIDQLIREIMTESNFSLDTLVSPANRESIRDNAPSVLEVNGYKQLKITYRSGVPYHHVSRPDLVLEWPEALALPDNRIVTLVYQKENYTYDELKQLALAS